MVTLRPWQRGTAWWPLRSGPDITAIPFSVIAAIRPCRRCSGQDSRIRSGTITGHSTGEAACLFAGAPDLRLRPIKGLLDPVGDLLTAIESTPTLDLIINSWGYDADQCGWDDLECSDPNLHHYLKILETVIAFAATRGVAVCAAAPTIWQSFPACHPDVIAIAAMTNGRPAQQGSIGLGASGLYPGRQMPDLWSDAARSVRAGADLIGCIQPAQPGSTLAHPGLKAARRDEGFAWCDIEQAAAPLAASRLALLLEQHRGVSPIALKAMVVAADAPWLRCG